MQQLDPTQKKYLINQSCISLVISSLYEMYPYLDTMSTIRKANWFYLVNMQHINA
jgi:hypothetical protein